jgi:multicomponent K+:H+ antiporter subunit A
LIGEIELASATAFDLGVMLTVVGAVLLSLRQISRVEQRAEHEPVPEGPMDIQLPAAPEPHIEQPSEVRPPAVVEPVNRGDC